ncbi:hypothetical protein Y032_0011g1298 [Ancylostoma ceylanicum]|uniref:Sushi domain-containing protein n=1 Tax=Ancylostoma ceylanicum TaxID=53326 RepID=A0A016VDA5_9BILA|nr:hypothetical protein Y032_0011g1298 [Ancylostoma ceylanicum]
MQNFQGRECQRLPQRVGAEIIYTPSLWRENVTEGTNATLKCRDYEHVVGTGTSTCVSGAWHPQSVGECSNTPSLDTPKLCHPLNAPYNGTVSLSKGSPDFPAENGVVAMLVCKPGTFVLGSTTSLCTGGTWIPSTLGTCNSNANSGGVETGCNWMFAPHGMFLNWSNINFGGPILNGTQLTANCVNSAPITVSHQSQIPTVESFSIASY